MEILVQKKKMKNNTIPTRNKKSSVRLHLELKNEYLSDEQKRILRRYGGTGGDGSITRDILIPSDMPLHNLHYAIQKLFGWENSHLRSFYLPDADYDRLTGRTVKGWATLVGVVFQPPSEGEDDIFWDDDYRGGSFKTWLRKKYTGPYFYGGTMEELDVAQQDIQELLNHYKNVNVRESLSDYFERVDAGDDSEIKFIKTAPLIDLTIEEMFTAIIFENSPYYLLERLKVDEVLAYHDETVSSDTLFPVTNELIYNYDFGDNWIVNITKHKNCDDLIKSNLISQSELEEAEDIVEAKYKPVCIHKVGINVLDDVGALHGFANFLKIIYESDNKDEAAFYRTWAKSQGWSPKKISLKSII